MYIKKLELSNFRNLININKTFNKKINVIIGKNGQGKTNFIEGIYILLNNKSFRKITRNELINYNKDKCHIGGTIEKDSLDINIKIFIENHKKKVFINNKLQNEHLYKEIKNTYFLNSDVIFYFKNFSSFRKKFIDRLCFHIFDENFALEYKKLFKAVQQIRADKENKIWLTLLNKQRNIINEYRKNFFLNIKEEYEKIKDFLNIKDLTISLKIGDKTEVNFKRNDKKDLSLGELKSIIFAILVATLKKNLKNNKILIIDDFNSEWDNIMLKKILLVLESLKQQSFIASTEFINIYPHFIVEKGEVIKNEWSS